MRLLVLLLAAVFLAGCAVPPPSPYDAAATLSQAAASLHVCDVSVAVIRDKTVVAVQAAAGCTPNSPHPDAVFKVASLGKPVFAWAVLRLAAQGRLDLDAPLLRYLPHGYVHLSDPFARQSTADLVTDPRLASVTARQVLSHTSGLPNWADGPLKFEFDPGERWQYSGEGYLLLQRVVEAISGEDVERFMADQVFVPLGMHDSAYVWDDRFSTRFVAGHAHDGSVRGVHRFTSPVVATTLYTTVGDYARFVVALLDDAQALRIATNAPVAVDPDLHLSWGLGWAIEQEPGERWLWHWGNTSGYRALVIVSPAGGDGFVMLTDSDDGMALGRSIAQTVFARSPRLLDFRMLR
jgi:CubicO group peptidase (beta-lactamase class C family)